MVFKSSFYYTIWPKTWRLFICKSRCQFSTLIFVWNVVNDTITRNTFNTCWSYPSGSVPPTRLVLCLKFHLHFGWLSNLALALAVGFSFATPLAFVVSRVILLSALNLYSIHGQRVPGSGVVQIIIILSLCINYNLRLVVSFVLLTTGE